MLDATLFWKFGFEDKIYILELVVAEVANLEGGGGGIDFCPCYGQIAFYRLITFSCQPTTGFQTKILKIKNQIKIKDQNFTGS